MMYVLLMNPMLRRFGSPKELLELKGQFYDMVHHSGEEEDLASLMTGKIAP